VLCGNAKRPGLAVFTELPMGWKGSKMSVRLHDLRTLRQCQTSELVARGKGKLMIRD